MSGDKAKAGASWIKDLLGGTTAMLVAFPSAIAFGLVVYAGIGEEFAARGAVYGILGALALGIVAPLFGGRPGAVSAPCAPSAAVLAALVATLTGKANTPEQVVVLLGVVGIGAAGIQALIGILGGGRLIKFIPYPVVAGYLASVGLMIIGSQLPKLLSLPAGTDTWVGLTSPSLWTWQALVVGGVTIAFGALAPLVTKKVPAPIIGLVAGGLAYGVLCIFHPALRALEGNALVIGPLDSGEGLSVSAVTARFKSVGSLGIGHLTSAIVPALTLAVLLSVDTLKTCVLVDALTRSRHDSDKELRGQGLGNAVSALLGGMPGAATAGPTLVNVSSGGRTRISGIAVGVASLAAFVFLGGLVAWVPVPALAGILIVVGVKMVDPHSFDLLRRRSTMLDFAVVAAVVATALLSNLIYAAVVGLILAIFLFVRDQAQTSVVRRTLLGKEVSSKKRRVREQRQLLEECGEAIALFELQGNLFFGTTDQLFTELEPHIAVRRFVLLNMRRVDSLDFTAGRMLHQIAEQLEEQGGQLVFSGLPPELQPYLKHFEVIMPLGSAPVLPTSSDALAWAEDRILEEQGKLRMPHEPPYGLEQIDLLEGLPEEALARLGEKTEEVRFEANEKLFARGDPGDTLYLVRRGTVKIMLPLQGGAKHLATIGRGDFFGDMALLDPTEGRSADAVAESVVEAYALTDKAFEELRSSRPEVAQEIYLRMAKVMAFRLRTTARTLRSLAEA